MHGDSAGFEARESQRHTIDQRQDSYRALMTIDLTSRTATQGPARPNSTLSAPSSIDHMAQHSTTHMARS